MYQNEYYSQNALHNAKKVSSRVVFWFVRKSNPNVNYVKYLNFFVFLKGIKKYKRFGMKPNFLYFAFVLV
jgi:hypothetical protein